MLKHVSSREERRAAEEIANRAALRRTSSDSSHCSSRPKANSKPGFARPGHLAGMQASRRAIFSFLVASSSTWLRSARPSRRLMVKAMHG